MPQIQAKIYLIRIKFLQIVRLAEFRKLWAVFCLRGDTTCLELKAKMLICFTDIDTLPGLAQHAFSLPHAYRSICHVHWRGLQSWISEEFFLHLESPLEGEGLCRELHSVPFTTSCNWGSYKCCLLLHMLWKGGGMPRMLRSRIHLREAIITGSLWVLCQAVSFLSYLTLWGGSACALNSFSRELLLL